MTRTRPFLFVVLLGCGSATPGIISATASDSSEGGGSVDTSTSNGVGIASTMDPEESSSADIDEPKLDVLPPPSDCEGVCGIEWNCYGPVGRGRAVTMLPNADSLFLFQGAVSASFGIVIGSLGRDSSTVLPTPATGFMATDVAVDDESRAAVLFAGADGYLLQRRSPPSYTSDWEHDLSPTDGASLVVTDIAVAGDGTVHVVGSTVDDAIGVASTELVVRTYAADGNELSAWSEPGALGVEPRLMFDHVDGSFVVWAEVVLDGAPEHHYWVRRIDGFGDATESVDLSFAQPIVDRPGRRGDGWLAVSGAGTGLALHRMDDAFATTGLVYDVPPAPEVIRPLRLQVVDDAAVVFVQPQPEIVRIRFYDADGVYAVPPQEDLHEDGAGPVSIIDLAANHGGRAGLLIGHGANDESMTFCDLDFSGGA